MKRNQASRRGWGDPGPTGGGVFVAQAAALAAPDAALEGTRALVQLLEPGLITLRCLEPLISSKKHPKIRVHYADEDMKLWNPNPQTPNY